MYAIIEIGRHQYKVSKKDKLFVNKLHGNEGDKIVFNKVLLTDNNSITSVGQPHLSGIEVQARIIKHLKANKEQIFKKKRRKGYQKLNGHRQRITQIEILSIGSDLSKSKSKEKELKSDKNSIKTKTEKKVQVEKKSNIKSSKNADKKKSVKKINTNADDLIKIDGIGPRIAELLISGGIDTFKKLSKNTPESLKKVLSSGGSRYSSRNTSSWSQQAKLAAEGNWDELKKLQNKLKEGK